MKDAWQLFHRWFYARQTRERAMIIMATVIVLGTVWIEFGAVRWEKAIKDTRQKIEAIQSDRIRLSAELAAAAQTAQPDFNERAAAERRLLQEQLRQLDQQLRAAHRQLFSAADTRHLLDQLLQSQPLRLQRMSRLPTAEEKLGDDPSLPVLYRHRLLLELQGTYPEVQAFLHRLQNSALQAHWKRVRVANQDYPQLLLEIELVFPSFEEHWLVLE